MAGSLTDYLDAWLMKRERYGEADCALFMADWIRAKRGIDPAAPWRGRYETPMQALRIVKRAGGLKAIVGKALRSHGIVETDDPKAGDIAVVNVPSDRMAFGGVGAIFASPRALAVPLENGGLICARADLVKVLAAWSV